MADPPNDAEQMIKRISEIAPGYVPALRAFYRKQWEDELLSDETKQAAIESLRFRLGHSLNEAAVAVVLEAALATTQKAGE